MFFITGGVSAMRKIERTRTVALGSFAAQESLFLLGIDVAYDTFFTFEVEGHRVILIGVRPHLENGSPFKFSCGISHTRGMHDTAVKTHIHLLTLQFHRSVIHLGTTIEMSSLRNGVVNE